MRGLIVGLTLALAACGQGADTTSAVATTAPEAQPPAFELSCAAFADITASTLGQRYGDANISVQTLPGPEGESYQATVVFADDPARRIEIVWNDATDHPASVSVGGDTSQWIGPGGLTPGKTVADVQTANGKPFTMSGFDWDYGGYVTNWRDGEISKQACHVSLRFQPRAQNYSAIGDGEFASNSAEVRSADAVVYNVGLNFPDE